MKKISPTFCATLLLLGPAVLLAGPVDVNTADAATLAAELNGVGPALAEAIVRDREANGKFETPEALMRVKGVGQHILDVNKENILVSAPGSPPAASPNGASPAASPNGGASLAASPNGGASLAASPNGGPTEASRP